MSKRLAIHEQEGTSTRTVDTGLLTRYDPQGKFPHNPVAGAGRGQLSDVVTSLGQRPSGQGRLADCKHRTEQRHGQDHQLVQFQQGCRVRASLK